jgi:hypothetical protein
VTVCGRQAGAVVVVHSLIAKCSGVPVTVRPGFCVAAVAWRRERQPCCWSALGGCTWGVPAQRGMPCGRPKPLPAGTA